MSFKSNISMDVIETEILPRLNVKSLLRFQCVCRSFKSLISNPDFARRHLHHSLSSASASDDNRLLVLTGNENNFYSFRLNSSEFPDAPLSFPTGVNQSPLNRLFVVGTCNGLVSMNALASPVIFVFNPYTRIYKAIPKGDHYWCSGCGFGFDDVKEDYKIVRIVPSFSRINEYGFIDKMWKVLVYSFKSDSWSLVERKVIDESIQGKESGALVNDCLVHWLFCDPFGRHRIGCFDLRKEQWGKDVPLPDIHSGTDEIKLIQLRVLDGSLCLLSTDDVGFNGVDIWVMKEYGVKHSWTKLANIAQTPYQTYPVGQVYPIGFANGSTNELLIMVDHSSPQLVWYNIQDNTELWAKDSGFYTDVSMCASSLISIPGGQFSSPWDENKSLCQFFSKLLN